MKFKHFIFIAFGAYMILISILVIAAYFVATVDEFAKLATVGVAILTGLLTVSVSTFSTYRNYVSEKEKGELNVTLSTMNSNFGKQLAELNSKLAGELEFNKGKMTWNRKAYDELSNVVSNLYYSLSIAETGSFDQPSVKNANTLAVMAIRYLGACSQADQDIWNDFRQRAKLIEEKLEPSTPAKRKSIWKEEVKEFGQMMKAFHLATEKAFNEFQAEG